MNTNSEFAATLEQFLADHGVRSRAEAELAVAVLLRVEHHRAIERAEWGALDVERVLRALPERLCGAGGGLVLSTFFTWLGGRGELSRWRARQLSDRAAAFRPACARPAA